MLAKELRAKTPEDLKKELIELRKEQFNLRMQKGIGQLTRPHLITQARLNIARVKTILREKELMGTSHE